MLYKPKSYYKVKGLLQFKVPWKGAIEDPVTQSALIDIARFETPTPSSPFHYRARTYKQPAMATIVSLCSITNNN